MVSAKQLSIAGIEPEHDVELERILEEVRRARGDHKRAAARLANAQAVAVIYQLEHKIARYEYSIDGGRYRSELSCPDPTMKLTFVGAEE